jgi:hypothetical protein
MKPMKQTKKKSPTIMLPSKNLAQSLLYNSGQLIQSFIFIFIEAWMKKKTVPTPKMRRTSLSQVKIWMKAMS